MSIHQNPVTTRDFGKASSATLEHMFSTAGYRARQWATLKQWNDAGRVVIKGERGTELTMPRGWTFRVFNYDQTIASDAPAPQADETELAVPMVAPAEISPLLASVIDATDAGAAFPAIVANVRDDDDNVVVIDGSDPDAMRARQNRLPLNVQQSADVAANKWGAQAGVDFIRRWRQRQAQLNRAQAKPMIGCGATDGTVLDDPAGNYARWQAAQRQPAPKAKAPRAKPAAVPQAGDFRQAFAAAAAARIAAE